MLVVVEVSKIFLLESIISYLKDEVRFEVAAAI